MPTAQQKQLWVCSDRAAGARSPPPLLGVIRAGYCRDAVHCLRVCSRRLCARDQVAQVLGDVTTTNSLLAPTTVVCAASLLQDGRCRVSSQRFCVAAMKMAAPRGRKWRPSSSCTPLPSLPCLFDPAIDRTKCLEIRVF